MGTKNAPFRGARKKAGKTVRLAKKSFKARAGKTNTTVVNHGKVMSKKKMQQLERAVRNERQNLGKDMGEMEMQDLPIIESDPRLAKHAFVVADNILAAAASGQGSNFSGANARGLRNILFGSYFNLGLLFMPLGVASQLAHWGDTATFALNFLAIIPLARLLGISTEELALQAGSTVGGLLNATFGNAIELILGLVALKEGLIRVVQASVLGSMLSNILLARWRRKEQVFNMTAAQTSSSLLALTCLSLLVPAAFVGSISTDNDMKHRPDNSQHSGTGIGDTSLEDEILSLSRGTAVVMLIVYGMFLFFQASLKTHSHLYEGEAGSGDEDEPTINTVTSVLLLIGVTLLVALHAEFLVGSIEGIVSEWHLTETFVGIILLPIVGNAAEHASSVTFAIRNKMDLSIGVAIGSSMQIGLFLTPALVLAGWIIGQPMTLYFHMFETTVLLVSVLVVNYLLQDGKSNWLEGAMLLSSYVIIGIAFFYYPANSG